MLLEKTMEGEYADDDVAALGELVALEVEGLEVDLDTAPVKPRRRAGDEAPKAPERLAETKTDSEAQEVDNPVPEETPKVHPEPEVEKPKPTKSPQSPKKDGIHDNQKKLTDEVKESAVLNNLAVEV